MIEIKKLELLHIQKKLRNAIAEEMTNLATLQLATSGDKTLLRRLRKVNIFLSLFFLNLYLIEMNIIFTFFGYSFRRMHNRNHPSQNESK
jgi:hypothetical protein